MAMDIFDLPTKIIFGVKSVQQLGKEANPWGQKALVVTYSDIRKTGLLDRVLDDLKSNGLECVVFDEVEPNPRSTTVDRGAAIARAEKVDLVIGLGGGSAMDAAKGIALASSGTVPIWTYAERKTATGHVPPIIQVPTLAGTGAETSGGAVITNWERHTKKSIVSPFVRAKVAIIDPELTLTVPQGAMKAGAVDAFCHAAEPYITAEATASLTDGVRETVMRMVLKYLLKAIERPDDIEARTQLSWASMMAMSPMARLGGGGGSMTCHGLGHALSAYYDISHGNSLAALILPWMRFNYPMTQERFKQLGTNVFGGKDAITSLEEWLESVGMKLRLSDLGFELDRATEIAGLAVKASVSLRYNPIPIDEKIAAQIYRDAY